MIVVGGGGSGLAAAARGSQLGLRCLVLEKRPQLGGTTGIAVGSFTANGTRQQQRQNVQDSLDDHAVDAGKFAPAEIEARNHEELRRFFLSHTADTLAWLGELGLRFHGPSPEPPNRCPRMHNVVPSAKAYIAALQTVVLKHGGRILTRAAVTQLAREDGRCRCVEASVDGATQSFRARAVVLAAGDYANSPDLIARFKGDAFSAVEGINVHATGDGQRLVEQAGGKLLNMDVTYGPELRFVAPPSRRWDPLRLLPTSGPLARILGALTPWAPQSLVHAIIKRQLVTWQHPEDGLLDAGAILLNHEGRRFCDERRSPDRELAVAQQSQKQAFLLLDADLVAKFEAWPNFVSTAPEIAYAYVSDYLKLRRDIAIEADSLRSLASKGSLPLEALESTIGEVNSSRAHGAGSLPPLGQRDGRWVLLGPLKAYFTTTEGGAAINQQFEVLDEQGDAIPGLYAVGQNGLGGQILWGHGLHIAWAITSGRLVGEQLAATPKAPYLATKECAGGSSVRQGS